MDKHEEEKFRKEFNRSVEAGRKAFELLVDETEGRGGRMVLAISSMLASMEAQSPGFIEDTAKGANLMVDRIADMLAGDLVNKMFDGLGKSRH